MSEDINKIEINEDENVKLLLKKNLELNQEILKSVLFIKRQIIWQQVLWYIKFLIIMIPIILGIIYLPPLINDLLKQYQGILSGGAINNQSNPGSIVPLINKIK